MLIPAGVLVPIADTGAVLECVALGVRTGRVGLTPTLVRLVAELELAARPSDSRPAGNGQLPDARSWVTVAEMARAAGVTERAIRYRIHAGSLNGRMVAGVWLIEEDP